MSIDEQHLERVFLDDLRGHTICLVGIYGDMCVFETAKRLIARGMGVVILEDACLWSCPLEDILKEDAEIRGLPRAKAVELWPDLKAYSETPEIWEGVLSL